MGKQRKYNIGNCDKRTAEKIFKNFCEMLENEEVLVEATSGKKLSDFLNEYEVSCKLVKAPRTLLREKKVFENFMTFAGDIDLRSLEPIAMENYRRYRLDAGISPATINLEFRHLKVAFNTAMRWKLINQNPLDGVRPIRVPQSDFPRYLSLDEIKKTLEAFSGTRYEPIVRFYLGTGARLGEGLSLTWSDINFARGQVIIKGINAKGKRNRVIPLKYSPSLIETLNNLRRREDGKVFGPFDNRGKELPQWSEWWVGRHISRVLTSIGLPWATCHTFRHTFASHLVMAGVPLFTVQRLLGHAQIDTTMIYAHLAPEHNEAMMARLPYAQTMEDNNE
jgi:integrase